MEEFETLDTVIPANDKSRRKLLPIWIKIFLWIFMVFGAIIPFGLISGILGHNFNISLYGIETTIPLSIIGLSLLALFALKGVVSFGLWTEKGWAIKLAILDGFLGINICIIVMVGLLPFIDTSGNSLRLELVFLIPYLMKMVKIRKEWEGIG